MKDNTRQRNIYKQCDIEHSHDNKSNKQSLKLCKILFIKISQLFIFLLLQGYALFGNVVCLFLTTIGYHHSHSFFYALWLLFGGLSAAKLVSNATGYLLIIIHLNCAVNAIIVGHLNIMEKAYFDFRGVKPNVLVFR